MRIVLHESDLFGMKREIFQASGFAMKGTSLEVIVPHLGPIEILINLATTKDFIGASLWLFQ